MYGEASDHVALRHLLYSWGIGVQFHFALHDCCTLTSTANFLFRWQGTQPAILQLFPRYSVDIYKCTNASELILKSQQESMWVAKIIDRHTCSKVFLRHRALARTTRLSLLV